MGRNEKAIRACVDFTDFQSLSLVRSKASSFAKYKGSRVTSSVLERKLTRLNSEGSNHGARNEEQGQLQRLNSQDGDELGRQPNFDGPSQIDLAISAQERFQGLTESEQELKTRSVSQDVLNLVIGGLAIAAMIFGVSLAGLPAALPLILVFSIGYLAIIFESAVDINKSSSALLMAVACWCLVGNAANLGHEQVIADLDKCLASVSQIFFFLLSAMTVVETIDAHNGFSFLTNKIRTTDKGTLLVIISTVTFFLSAVLDNLTTTIVMCSLLSRLVSDEDVETRKVRNETEHDKLEPERAREEEGEWGGWGDGGEGGTEGGTEGGRGSVRDVFLAAGDGRHDGDCRECGRGMESDRGRDDDDALDRGPSHDPAAGPRVPSPRIRPRAPPSSPHTCVAPAPLYPADKDGDPRPSRPRGGGR